jgi:RHH-type proline utilization regulon transcriptional repressor/proline dehydrogenase/delta 1-pyrroline-5-carboxylate dehydrogenase
LFIQYKNKNKNIIFYKSFIGLLKEMIMSSAFCAVQSSLRSAITAAYRVDEKPAVLARIEEARLSVEDEKNTQQLARRLVTHVRQNRSKSSGVDALMQEFSLDSEEGVALMCLAEALLRIPDAATANKLIRDKIGGANWVSHLGQSDSLFVNAAAWGLVLTGKLVESHSETGLGAALTRLVAKGGESLIRKGVDVAMRLLGQQFVTGQDIHQAIKNGREREKKGYQFSYDMLGEAAMTEADAQRYLADYVTAIHAIGAASAGAGIQAGPGLSVKLSALHPRYSRAQVGRVMSEMYPRVKSLFVLAKKYNIGLNIDAEEADRLEISLDLIEALAQDADLAGFDGIGIVVQAYQKRCPFVIDFLVDLAKRTEHRFMVRLVKGAYWDSEIKRAQVDGLSGYPVFTQKAYTDVSYLACAKRLLAAQDVIYPQFATHNAYTVAAIYHLGQGLNYEFQCLHGMGETLYDQVVGQENLGKLCRIYAPVGSHETLLAYLVRRLLENGANSSFVNRIVDEKVSLDELLADPIQTALALGGAAHRGIPLPRDIFNAHPALQKAKLTRLAAKGFDVSNEDTLAELHEGITLAATKTWHAAPMLANDEVLLSEGKLVRNPANLAESIGTVVFSTLNHVDKALAAAEAYGATWAKSPVSERATCLNRMADLMENEAVNLMYLAIKEAGKTLPNAIAEVKEAVDFCRYYAAQITADWSIEAPAPLGPVVCISPWNFPLAIFVGEVAAALAAGNVVLAKPAEQTSLIAAYAVELFYQAGVPRAALQFLPGLGEVVGAALTQDQRVKGVIFTGSAEVARLINQTLAARADGQEVVLIAETGGQNAMIVDSSALPEQVVTDVLSSAFDSAGQRCSALRVLYLQENVADKILTMLKGAMNELCVGNPAELATDIGPVIDTDAQQALLMHISKLKKTAASSHQSTLTEAARLGHFVTPTLFEIDDLSALEHEVFGPVLHVLRFKADELPKVMQQINATGFGLTHGVHSRIDETINSVVQTVKAGNVYVNRNIVGAVVGVQPFGGEGLSGTGPKAGGAYYLYRLTQAPTWQPLQVEARQQAVTLPALTNLLLWLKDKYPEQYKKFANVADETPLAEKVQFVSYTGEDNEAYCAPRGHVACVASNEGSLCQQLVAAYATGNVAVVPATPLTLALQEKLGAALITAENVLQVADLQAVLFEGSPEEATAIRRQLAARKGAIVAFVAQENAGYNLHRLVVERSVSINTTAAGGNASLMAMSL